MTVEQARYEFVMIYDEVFKDASLPREVRSNKLRKAIESLLERKELPLDTKLLRDGASGSSTRT